MRHDQADRNVVGHRHDHVAGETFRRLAEQPLNSEADRADELPARKADGLWIRPKSAEPVRIARPNLRRGPPGPPAVVEVRKLRAHANPAAR